MNMDTYSIKDAIIELDTWQTKSSLISLLSIIIITMGDSSDATSTEIIHKSNDLPSKRLSTPSSISHDASNILIIILILAISKMMLANANI